MEIATVVYDTAHDGVVLLTLEHTQTAQERQPRVNQPGKLTGEARQHFRFHCAAETCPKGEGAMASGAAFLREVAEFFSPARGGLGFVTSTDVGK